MRPWSNRAGTADEVGPIAGYYEVGVLLVQTSTSSTASGEATLIAPGASDTINRARFHYQLSYSGAASSAVAAAFSWIIERKYAMFNLSTVSSGWWYQG